MTYVFLGDSSARWTVEVLIFSVTSLGEDDVRISRRLAGEVEDWKEIETDIFTICDTVLFQS